ncbi:hypothetical protein [Comamonas humi]
MNRPHMEQVFLFLQIIKVWNKNVQFSHLKIKSIKASACGWLAWPEVAVVSRQR